MLKIKYSLILSDTAIMLIIALLGGFSCSSNKHYVFEPIQALTIQEEEEIYRNILQCALNEVTNQYNVKRFSVCCVAYPKENVVIPKILKDTNFPIPLKPKSECKLGGEFKPYFLEVREKKTNKDAIKIIIGELKFVENDLIKSYFGWDRNSLAARLFTVTLKKIDGIWKISEVECVFMA